MLDRIEKQWTGTRHLQTNSKSITCFYVHMKKQPLWDFDGLTKSLIICIKVTGYAHNITITFTINGKRISVYRSGAFSKAAHDNCLRCLCVVTCLCIIFAPIYYASSKMHIYLGHKVDNIICEFPVLMPASDFYTRNYHLIQHVNQKTKISESCPIKSFCLVLVMNMISFTHSYRNYFEKMHAGSNPYTVVPIPPVFGNTADLSSPPPYQLSIAQAKNESIASSPPLAIFPGNAAGGIPDGSVLYPGQRSPTKPNPSVSWKYESSKSNNVISYDPALDFDV